MDEVIDYAFLGAKITTRDNAVASLVVHSMSMAYNIGQMAKYRYWYMQSDDLCQFISNQQAMAFQENYRREMIKYAVLSGLDGLWLIIKNVSELYERR